MILQQQQHKPIIGKANNIKMPLTFSETLFELKERGYPFKFRRDDTSLYCVELDSWFPADSFTIDECYHFESGSRYGDRMLYAISSVYGLKGFLVDNCFFYSGSIIPDSVGKPEWEYMLQEEIFA